jgi:hypothetical protein
VSEQLHPDIIIFPSTFTFYSKKGSKVDISTFKKLEEKQQQSGLLQKDFCKQEGIKPAVFSYWKKKLKDSKATNPFIEIQKPKLEKSCFPLGKHLPFEYQTPLGSRLFIPQDFNEHSLKKLLRIVS